MPTYTWAVLNRSPQAAWLFIWLLLGSCEHGGKKAKQSLNKGGWIAGTVASEVVEGVTTGVERSWSIQVDLSPEWQTQGFKLGKK